MIQKIKKAFLNFGPIVQWLPWSKTHSLPGFYGVSIYTTLSFINFELKKNDLETRASAMSYNFFLALVPTLIFLFTLTAYLPKSWDFFTTLENSLNSIMPEGAKDYLWKNIVGAIRPKANKSFLSIGFLLAVFFASNGILSMMSGFDKTYRSSFRRRSWIEKHLIALLLTFLLSILLIFSIVLIIMGSYIFHWVFVLLKLGTLAALSIKLLQYVIIILLFYTVIDLIYRFGPALRKPMKGFSPGTIFATTASILTSVVFGYFVENFSSYHKIYGAISALIITLVWIRINVLILILGFELNAGIIINRDILSDTGEADVIQSNQRHF